MGDGDGVLHQARLGTAGIPLCRRETSSVVGHTADILLEVDEAQDVSKDKYSKEFRPMASAHNTTTVHYGTTWDDSTLLEEIKQTNLELEKGDGIKRHFRYDWQEVAKYNPSYGDFVNSELSRLGEDHPLFKTQYALQPIRGGGGFLSALQISLLGGAHHRLHHPPKSSGVFIAGIDLAGEAEVNEDLILVTPGRDATVITIGEIVNLNSGDVLEQPRIRVVEHYCWVGIKHAELFPKIIQIVKNIWNCQRIVCDATGIGEPITSFLQQKLGTRIVPFKFTQKSKSEAGFDLLAAINSARLKIYRGDGSGEHGAYARAGKGQEQLQAQSDIKFLCRPVRRSR